MKLFDTSVIIGMIRDNVFEIGAISVFSLVEVLRGVSEGKRARVKEKLEEAFDVIGLDNKVILEYCRLYNLLRGEGELISDADLLIAASAKAHGLEFVTLDSDFARFKKYGLKVTILR